MKLNDIRIEDLFNTLDERGLSYGRFAGQGIARGMEPWVPHKVILEWEFDIDYNRYRVWGTAYGNFWRYEFPILISHRDMLEPLVWSEKLYYGFLKAFRNREADPVPSNISLGEN